MILALIVVLCAFSVNAKTLVVYCSFTNNIERVVNELKTQIECDVVEIEPAEKGLDYAANNSMAFIVLREANTLLQAQHRKPPFTQQ